MEKQPLPRSKTTATIDDRAAEQTSRLLVIWQRYFYHLIIIELIIIFGAGYWFLLKPNVKAVFSSRAEISLQDKAQQKTIAELNAQIKELGQIKEGYVNLSPADRERIGQMLPAKSEERDLVTQINKIVAANGMLLKSISLEDESGLSGAGKGRGLTESGAGNNQGAALPAPSAKAEAVKVDFEVSGVSYPALKSLLAGLENNLRLIDAQAVKYSPPEESAILVVKAYYQTDGLASTVDLGGEDVRRELDFITSDKWRNLRSNAEAIEIQTRGNKNPF